MLNREFLLFPSSSLKEAVECIEKNNKGAALIICEKTSKLLAIITDGDIRRCFLKALPLETKLNVFIEYHQEKVFKPQPYSLPSTADQTTIRKVMTSLNLRHIPLIDEQGRPVEIALREDYFEKESLPLKAVIMAGGKGERLYPLTNNTPKPMLAVGNAPLLELVVKQVVEVGIKDIVISVLYKKDQIMDFFQDGTFYGANITYLEEKFPLGTAGSLSFLPPSESSILVVNGDILTNVNFKEMYHFHSQHNSDLTMAIKTYEYTIPYGVLDIEGIEIRKILEKPKKSYFVNSGIYILSPELLELIPTNKFYNMTDLANQSLQKQKKIAAFHIHEYWNDIGQMEDYKKANADIFYFERVR